MVHQTSLIKVRIEYELDACFVLTSLDSSGLSPDLVWTEYGFSMDSVHTKAGLSSDELILSTYFDLIIPTIYYLKMDDSVWTLQNKVRNWICTHPDSVRTQYGLCPYMVWTQSIQNPDSVRISPNLVRSHQNKVRIQFVLYIYFVLMRSD